MADSLRVSPSLPPLLSNSSSRFGPAFRFCSLLLSTATHWVLLAAGTGRLGLNSSLLWLKCLVVKQLLTPSFIPHMSQSRHCSFLFRDHEAISRGLNLSPSMLSNIHPYSIFFFPGRDFFFPRVFAKMVFVFWIVSTQF